jgi:Zn-dependent protease
MFDTLLYKLYALPGFIMGLALHEFGHAWMANRLGDPTPRNEGRLTISPKSHIDPLGLLFFLFSPFGWAKPVNIRPGNFNDPKRDHMLVSLAGPLVNLFIGIFFVFLIKILIITNSQGLLSNIVYQTSLQVFISSAAINFLLLVLNLLPIGFLDGYVILSSLLPNKYYEKIQFLQIYGFQILFGLIILSFIGVPVLYYILSLPSSLLMDLFFISFGI